MATSTRSIPVYGPTGDAKRRVEGPATKDGLRPVAHWARMVPVDELSTKMPVGEDLASGQSFVSPKNPKPYVPGTWPSVSTLRRTKSGKRMAPTKAERIESARNHLRITAEIQRDSDRIRAEHGLEPVPVSGRRAALIAEWEALAATKAAKPKAKRAKAQPVKPAQAVQATPTVEFTAEMAFRMSGKELKALAGSDDCGAVATAEIQRRAAKRKSLVTA